LKSQIMTFESISELGSHIYLGSLKKSKLISLKSSAYRLYIIMEEWNRVNNLLSFWRIKKDWIEGRLKEYF